MKKLLLLLLTLALLLSLAACKEKGNGGGGDTDPSGNTPPAGETPTEEATSDPNDRDDLGEISLGDREIRIMARVEQSNENELDPIGEETDIVDNAVFRRNERVQDRLHCTIRLDQFIGSATQADMDRIPQQVRAMVNYDANDVDLIANASYTTVPLGFQGYLCNLQETNRINLEKNYWSESYNTALSHGDAQYCATGPISLSYYRYMFVTLFNKQMVAAQSLENPYEVVNRGEWTIGYLKEKAALFYDNLNGGAIDFEDRFGYCVRIGPTSSMLDGYWEGTGISVLKKTDDNRLTFSLEKNDRDRIHASMDALLDLLDSDGVICGGETDEDILKKFTVNQSAFITYRLLGVESGQIKEMTNDYGILPMPKLTVEQEYSNNIQVEILVYAIPYTCRDSLDEIGSFLECLASESYAHVKPAYCEVALTGQYFKDPQSVAMFDLIVKSVAVDPMSLYTRSFDFSCEAVRTIHVSGTNTVLGMIDSYHTNTTTMVDKINTFYDDALENHNKPQ